MKLIVYKEEGTLSIELTSISKGIIIYNEDNFVGMVCYIGYCKEVVIRYPDGSFSREYKNLEELMRNNLHYKFYQL